MSGISPRGYVRSRLGIYGEQPPREPANEKRGEKVEIFDEALARVNERLDAICDAE
jgi:hypothetical protein